MRYLFLTACRNEAAILEEFLDEFTEVVRTMDIAANTRLFVVDDYSTDRSVEIIEQYARRERDVEIQVIRAPTNFGNQGAMFFGLSALELEPDDVLITFDCDGEDDVRQIPSIVALGSENPGKVVLIERGQRRESIAFRVSFVCYKLLFRYLTRQRVIPNNFLLIPGRYVPVIQRTPLAAVHFAYAVLRTRFPSVSTQRDRRPRYGGKSSQSLFMVASHGLVGLMVFFETVIAKLLLQLVLFGVVALGVTGAGFAVPAEHPVHRMLVWAAAVIASAGFAFFSLLLASALALLFKLLVFTLTRLAVETRLTPARPTSTIRETPSIPRRGVGS